MRPSNSLDSERLGFDVVLQIPVEVLVSSNGEQIESLFGFIDSVGKEVELAEARELVDAYALQVSGLHLTKGRVAAEQVYLYVDLSPQWFGELFLDPGEFGVGNGLQRHDGKLPARVRENIPLFDSGKRLANIRLELRVEGIVLIDVMFHGHLDDRT